MNYCKECIVYQIQNNLSEPDLCENCGKNTMNWKLGKMGTPHVECSECGYMIAVDLNTPCELDHAFNKKYEIIVESQKELPDAKTLMKLAKFLNSNSLQAREKLENGFSTEMDYYALEKLTHFLFENNIPFIVKGYEDLKEKYSFYKECKYPYSSLRHFK